MRARPDLIPPPRWERVSGLPWPPPLAPVVARMRDEERGPRRSALWLQGYAAAVALDGWPDPGGVLAGAQTYRQVSERWPEEAPRCLWNAGLLAAALPTQTWLRWAAEALRGAAEELQEVLDRPELAAISRQTAVLPLLWRPRESSLVARGRGAGERLVWSPPRLEGAWGGVVGVLADHGWEVQGDIPGGRREIVALERGARGYSVRREALSALVG